ncbi:hypothetical protein N7499_011998 [Penicillium canescens]|uniref:RBR-type E3 ubiquitin transferase n=1 Tax=Penicillium canescens TaxID=5083 RepID=A0AAD6IL53_PENCN|nr:uncharacterized protein N7446_007266 [Penicillium canescens]KAJ5991339.1 hypothetical protein N7522_011546 [Penicillium canescens]KAJ6049402.1 hypothetical protein N7444_006118 [Penicillium canescens]KAJ6052629.1 hypothetical protein N7460_003163 [Penicillium canescens]KAJ6063146.1 hypothetical protein N7446_007266 [Penicillium canescens]KAJ6070111.1 hypothetical protein N7499_011998 [Penicillium canescens]
MSLVNTEEVTKMSQSLDREPQKTSADDTTTTEGSQGKGVEGILADPEPALREWRTTPEEESMAQNDRLMAISMTRAVQHDGATIALILQQENRAATDRAFAMGLDPTHFAQNIRQANPEAIQKALDFLEGELMDFEYTESHAAGTPADADLSEPSKDAAKTQPSVPTSRKCVACMESFCHDIIEAPCSDFYCKDCILRLFNDSFVDQSVFPPRCCGVPIPPSSVHQFIGAGLAQQYEEKVIEQNDPFRTYCSDSSCSQYIVPERVNGYIGRCICDRATCTLCKQMAHSGVPCPEDPSGIQQLSKEQGWQKCANCGAVVQLASGCNHISCRCGFEFCYACALQWKTCQCETWDERTLLAQAQEIAARNEAGAPAPEAVENIVAQLRVQQECDHEDDWVRIEGEHNCDECDEHMPCFILQCPGCNMRACQRCLEEIQEEEDCDHDGLWRRLEGQHECEECEQQMARFILECPECAMWACQTCVVKLKDEECDHKGTWKRIDGVHSCDDCGVQMETFVLECHDTGRLVWVMKPSIVPCMDYSTLFDFGIGVIDIVNAY